MLLPWIRSGTIKAKPNGKQKKEVYLSSNAVKFTPKGGKVIIATNPVSEGWVEISFKDTGVWMNPEMKENLFKLDVNTTAKELKTSPAQDWD